jgi:hypothetical protein
MSRTRHWIFLVPALVALAAPAIAADADWMRPKVAYTARTVMRGDTGTIIGRVWASGDKERRELLVNGARHAVILRRDRGVSWILMPDQRMYLEQGLEASGADRFQGGHLEREALGEESVNGVPATKYRVHGTAADGAPFDGLLWMTEDEIPVRVVSGEGGEQVRMELNQLSTGRIDPSRFEIPAGWQRFELPGPAKADLDAYRRRLEQRR